LPISAIYYFLKDWFAEVLSWIKKGD